MESSGQDLQPLVNITFVCKRQYQAVQDQTCGQKPSLAAFLLILWMLMNTKITWEVGKPTLITYWQAMM
ncbi:hypothetical protein AgCh_028575 [Apium graveolens]